MWSEPKAGISQLKALVHDADARGFTLVSSEATAAMKKTSQTNIRQRLPVPWMRAVSSRANIGSMRFGKSERRRKGGDRNPACEVE
jgi:hypothetical protein